MKSIVFRQQKSRKIKSIQNKDPTSDKDDKKPDRNSQDHDSYKRRRGHSKRKQYNINTTKTAEASQARKIKHIQTDKGKSRKIKERQKTTIPPKQAGARLFLHRPDHKNSQSVKVMQNKHYPAQTKQLSRQGKIKQNQAKSRQDDDSKTIPHQTTAAIQPQ
jgi:hypothetical protein